MRKLLIPLFASALLLQSCAVGYPVVGRYRMPPINGCTAWVPMDGRIYRHKAVLDGVTYSPIQPREGMMVYRSPDGQYELEIKFSSVPMADTSKIFSATINNEK